MVINDKGFVGIGTLGPWAVLHVKGDEINTDKNKDLNNANVLIDAQDYGRHNYIRVQSGNKTGNANSGIWLQTNKNHADQMR